MSATTATAVKTLNIDGIEVPINGERNLLELIRKADIDLPTFCYHSDLSVYGACRLCLVDIAGRGIQGACSTPPEPGLKIRTQTEEIREIRKISIELLLANHPDDCLYCSRSGSCELQALAQQLGVRRRPVAQFLQCLAILLLQNGLRMLLCYLADERPKNHE